MRQIAIILAALASPVISFAQPERIVNQWNPNGDGNDLFLNPNGESIYPTL